MVNMPARPVLNQLNLVVRDMATALSLYGLLEQEVWRFHANDIRRDNDVDCRHAGLASDAWRAGKDGRRP
jgi:hypothetical protein